MTSIGLVVMAAGIALVWSGITDRPIIPEVRAALGNKKDAAHAGSTAGKFRADAKAHA